MTDNLMDRLAAMQAALKPMFDEQAAVWEREREAAMEAFNATGATLETLGGNCPVQAKGRVGEQHFYFRARYDEWQFHVAETKDEIFDAPMFYIERDYGADFDAGWMPRHEALAFIVSAIGEFREGTKS